MSKCINISIPTVKILADIVYEYIQIAGGINSMEYFIIYTGGICTITRLWRSRVWRWGYLQKKNTWNISFVVFWVSVCLLVCSASLKNYWMNFNEIVTVQKLANYPKNWVNKLYYHWLNIVGVLNRIQFGFRCYLGKYSKRVIGYSLF